MKGLHNTEAIEQTASKKMRETTPNMKVHALATPNMENSAHEAMSDPPKARYPPKKAGSQRRQNEGAPR